MISVKSFPKEGLKARARIGLHEYGKSRNLFSAAVLTKYHFHREVQGTLAREGKAEKDLVGVGAGMEDEICRYHQAENMIWSKERRMK